VSVLQHRSMEHWRKQGYLVAPVEHRKRFPAPGKLACRCCGHRQMIDIAVDMFNCFDLLAIHPIWQGGIANVVLIQVTDSTSRSKRREKIVTSPEAKLCSLAGIRILLETWKKRDNRWQVTDEWISIDQFPVDLPTTVAGFEEKRRKEKLPDVPEGGELFAGAGVHDDF